MSKDHYTVLVVEDSPEDRELYRRFLAQDEICSYTILEAATGRGGLELWRQHAPDIVLLDYRLPDLDGLEFLTQLHDLVQQPCLPVVMLTGLGNEAIAVKAIKAGAQDYLVKGQMTPEGLQVAIHSAIATIQLQTQLQQRIERERVISQITQQIHHSLDLNEILETTVREVRTFLQTDRVLVFRLNSDGQGQVITESVNPEWTPLLSTSFYDPCFSEQYIEPFRQGLIIQKTDIHDGSINPCHVELLDNLQVKANLVVPIVQDNQLWGMLIAHHCTSPRLWQTLEVDLLQELATQLGIALQQAELYQQAQTELAERKQAEAQLRESQHFIQQVAETTPGVLYIYDLIEQRNFYVNRQVSQLLGYTGEQVQAMGANFLPTLIHPEDFTQVPTHIAKFQSAQDNDVLELEYRMQHANGNWRWFHGREVVFSRTADGRPKQILGICQDITDRKQTEVALLATMERFEQAAAAVNALIYEWDLQRGIVERTRGLTELVGYTPEEAGYSVEWWSGLIHPDDLAEFDMEEFWNRVATEDRFSLEYRVRHKQGHYLWVQDYQIVIRDPNGQPIKLVGSTTNITSRKQAEAALRESEANLQRLIANIPVALYQYVVHPDGSDQFTYISPKGYEIYEYEPEVLQHNFQLIWSMIHPDDVEQVQTANQLSNENLTPFVVEFRIIPPSGRLKWIFCQAQPVRQSNGDVIWDGLVLDISDRKRAEFERQRRLIQAQQYTNQLRGLARAALAINSADTIDRILNSITEHAAHTIGCHQSVTCMSLEQDWEHAITAFYLSDKYAAWRNYNENPDGTGIYTLVCQLNRPLRMTQAELESHPRWQEFGRAAGKHPPLRGWLAVPLVNREGKNMGLIQVSDKYEGEFTEEDESILVQLAQMAAVAIENHQLYEAEQNARSNAERANRTKDEFLAVLSHELRTPLNPILGWTKLMQSQNFTPEKTADALATIERNAKLQIQLIDDLLDTARILRGKLSLNTAPINLVFVIEAAIDTVRTALNAKSIQLHSELPDIGQVAGDATRLQQVVWNLLSNAVKFTPEGGRIEVKLEQLGSWELGVGSWVGEVKGDGGDKGDEGVFLLPFPPSLSSPPSPSSLPSTSYAQITITDSGKGIDPKSLPRLFESFWQEDSSTSRSYGGLGLGLAIVRHLVEAHGGTVWAESPGVGQGSVFCVRLPLLTTQPTAAQPGRVTEPEQGLKGIRVLAVDDESDARELLDAILTQYDAEVLTVASAVEALSVLESFQPDVLVCDVGMPTLDGYALIQQVRSRPAEAGGQIPAIAVTAYAREEDRQRALAAGFQNHIAKPVDPNSLMQAISNLFQANSVAHTIKFNLPQKPE